MKTEKWFNVLFVSSIVLLHGWIGQQDIIPLRPQSVHQWAQCDRASVALNYYQEQMNFFAPRVHNLDNGTGITGLEFPLVNYAVAILYLLFGYHEWLYRLLELLIFSGGLFCVFLISKHYTGNKWMSMALALIFGSIPLLSFYTANFLPDIVSLSFLLCSWVFLIQANRFRTGKYFILTFTFLWLAALIKITSLVYIPAFACFILLNFKDIPKKKILVKLAGATFLLIGFTLPWYLYASWLSTKTHSEVFLLQFMPLTSLTDLMSVYDEISAVWLDRLFIKPLALFLFFFPLVFSMIPGLSRELRLFGLLIAGSVIFFMIGMWQQFRHHDYYMIMLCPLFLVSMLQIVSLFQKWNVDRRIILPLLFALVLMNTMRAREYLKLAYDRNQWVYGATSFDNYFDFEPNLREMGIARETPVISVFDHSPDISLYLMNQKGVTVSYRKTELTLQKYLSSRAFEFLIYNPWSNFEDIVFNEKKYPVSFEKDIYGIKVYRVNNFVKGTPVPDFKLSPWN